MLSVLRSFLLLLLTAFSLNAQAQNYTLSNTNPDTGDGGWISAHDWASSPAYGAYWQGFTIIGADRSAWMKRDTPWATFISNTTTFGTSFAEALNLSFDWRYTSADADLTADSAGYIINGIYYTLSDSSHASSAGHLSLNLAAGDSLAWFVSSSDELGGRATLAISNVSLSNFIPSPVAEPAPLGMWLTGLALCGLLVRRRTRAGL